MFIAKAFKANELKEAPSASETFNLVHSVD